MDKNCVDNAHKADWIREMNAMEHDCDEVRKDNRFNLTGWPYEVEGPAKPYSQQVGGSHYSKYAIQPVEYIVANGLNFCEGSIIKYVTRWRDKGGKQDLMKAKHFIDLLIEAEKL
jgi:hypothetical protein